MAVFSAVARFVAGGPVGLAAVARRAACAFCCGCASVRLVRFAVSLLSGVCLVFGCWLSGWVVVFGVHWGCPWWLGGRLAGLSVWGCAVASSSSAPAPRVPAPRGAAFVAFARGGLRSVLVRPGRSGAALVLVAGFAALPSAGRFAAWAARRSGCSVAVRPGPGGAGGAWLVSCPVAWSSSRLPACCGRSVFVAGGVRGLAAALARAGLPRVARGG